MQFTNNFMFDHLSFAAKLALKDAICTKGKRTGLVKKSAPKHGSLGYVGWMAIMAELNTQRLSVGGLMFMSQDHKRTFEECTKYCEKFHRFINCNLQNPFEFNMWHLHHE